ncbi:MAG TPA: hypothetical protein DCM71_00100 [Runella sp.]|nr:hypothetical protein [Runella sp.]
MVAIKSRVSLVACLLFTVFCCLFAVLGLLFSVFCCLFTVSGLLFFCFCSKPKTRNPKLETPNPKPETPNSKLNNRRNNAVASQAGRACWGEAENESM